MSGHEAIATLHRGMTRQGPGTPEDVLWALDRLEVPQAARIVDAGCGPGADTRALAEARPEGRVTGIEMMPHLAEEARAACAHLPNVAIETGDMGALTGPLDLIWCAGALYFLGVTEGLQRWRSALAPGGAVAFSEPALEAGAAETARDFWKDYPAITDVDGIRARVEAAGYKVVDHRLIKGAAWQGYYDQLSARIDALKSGATGDLAQLIDATAREIALWRAAPDDVTYALMLVRPEAGSDEV